MVRRVADQVLRLGLLLGILQRRLLLIGHGGLFAAAAARRLPGVVVADGIEVNLQ